MTKRCKLENKKKFREKLLQTEDNNYEIVDILITSL